MVTVYERRKEGNVLFNDAFNTFYLRLYGVGHNSKDHSDSERGNALPPLHGLLFPISSNGSFICIIPQTDNTYHGLCYTSREALAGTRTVYDVNATTVCCGSRVGVQSLKRQQKLLNT